MNKEIRLNKIQSIIDRHKDNPFGKQEIPWQDDLVSMNVYKVPLNLLVYNKYNGRILSRTKSLERQNHKVDEFSKDGKELIEKLLWESKKDRNLKTLTSLAQSGQEKIGIITMDGIIIDGNRRAMLLNDIQSDGRLSGRKFNKKFDYFKAVILPVTSSENPLEIERLETSYQMGEDEKLGYNPTEKYLKAKELYKRITNTNNVDISNLNDSAVRKIADWMGESVSEVEKYLITMDLMDDYLSTMDYEGIYTQLDKREDQFLSLAKWLPTFYGENSKKAFPGYKDTDVDDLKLIAFDLIRIRNEYDGKLFRNLAEGHKDKHFFGNKRIWESYSKNHFDIIDRIPVEPNIDYSHSNLTAHLNARDISFFEESKFGNEESALIENIYDHITQVRYHQAAAAPEKLLKSASKAIEAINTSHEEFKKPNVQKLVKKLSDDLTDSLSNNSPLNLLNQIVTNLQKIEKKDIPENEVDGVMKATKTIQSIAYYINKKIK